MSLSQLRIAPHAYKYTTSRSFSHSFYRFFSSFPHGTCTLSVNHRYLGLVGDATIFTQNYTTYHHTWNTVVLHTNWRGQTIHRAITFFGLETPFLYYYASLSHSLRHFSLLADFAHHYSRHLVYFFY